MRQVTIEEWNAREWVQVSSSDNEYIPSFKKTSPPPMPNDGFKYTLLEVTTLSDLEQKWMWVPVMTVDRL